MATAGTTPFNAKLRELIADRGVSLRALARAVFVDPGYLSRVANGHRQPAADLVQLLDTELGADGVLVALADERLDQAIQDPHQVDATALDTMAELLAATRRLEDVTSAGTVLPTIRSYIDIVDQFAGEARAPVRSTAVGLASELTQYAGWLQVPLRRWAAAERYLDRATVLGMEAGDAQRTATALSFAAYTAMRQGKTRQAAALNEAASRDTAVDLGLRTYITYQGAEILAGDDNQEARRLLHEAEGLAGRIDPAALPPSGYWYIPEFFLGTHAFVLDKLGERERARELMAESLAALPTEWRTAEWAERRRTFLAT